MPVLKESIAKIEQVYNPVGYRLNIPVGKLVLADQNMPPHFYLRLVRKYPVIDKGSAGIREHYKPAILNKLKKLMKLFHQI